MKITHHYAKYPGPLAYENEHLSLDTARVWALHYGVPCSVDIVATLAALDHPALTGEYACGDSWIQWGEEGAPGDWHVTVYLRASRPETALEVGRALAQQAYGTALTLDMFHVSTAGDFAEQLPGFSLATSERR